MPLKELKKATGRLSKRPAEAELSAMYQKMTAKEIAEHYGVATSTVKGWIYSYRKQEKEHCRC